MNTELDLQAKRKQEILRERAEILARAVQSDEVRESLEVVEFLLAGERYALETAHVQEVYALKELTPLPCTPPFVLGIINVHGHILPVIDVGYFFDLPFDLPTRGRRNQNRVIIVRAAGEARAEIGLLADAVVGVQSIDLQEIQTSLPALGGARAEYLRGVSAARLIILDALRIAGDERLIVREDMD